MIGLLSFHKANNYGAVLQAYALQKAIEKLGYNSEYLDLHFNKGNNALTKKKKNIYFLLTKLKNVRKSFLIRGRIRKFKCFCQNYIKVSSEKYYGDKNINDATKYDSYIVGSDQVWNLRITNVTKSFLLHFVNEKKRKSSYASSFGVDSLSKEHIKIFEKYLVRFDNISVRENQGVEIVRMITGREPQVCLDPTLLLPKKEWEEISEKRKYKKYVFIYSMDDSNSMLQKAKEIAREKSLKILAVGLKKKYKGIKNIYDASPQEWITLIKNADTIITNSFHGTVFSINFNKNFYLEYLPEGWTVNSRLENIVELFEIKNRLLNEEDNGTSIDYDAINRKLSLEREKSLLYLRKICDKNEQN